MITSNSRQIAIRVPHDELEAARLRAKKTERTLTAVIVDALREDRLRFQSRATLISENAFS